MPRSDTQDAHPAGSGQWWQEHGVRFLERCSKPRGVLLSERIASLAEDIRHALIEQYAPTDMKEKARLDTMNRDCLVRIYLGEARKDRPYMNFSLRNFALHWDQMTEVGVDARALAAAIGGTLSLMHFKVKTDVRDIEFVLGVAPASNRHQHRDMKRVGTSGDLSVGPEFPATQFEIFGFTVYLWVLDFNECMPITLDRDGMEGAVAAFFDNATYCPRPPKSTKHESDNMYELWNAFSESYWRISYEMLREEDEDVKRLPDFLLREIVVQAARGNKSKESSAYY